jgi:hypothetical protein
VDDASVLDVDAVAHSCNRPFPRIRGERLLSFFYP